MLPPPWGLMRARLPVLTLTPFWDSGLCRDIPAEVRTRRDESRLNSCRIRSLRDHKAVIPEGSSTTQTRCLKATSALQAVVTPRIFLLNPTRGFSPCSWPIPGFSTVVLAPLCSKSHLPVEPHSLKSTAASLHPDIIPHSWVETALDLAGRSSDSGVLCAKGTFSLNSCCPGLFLTPSLSHELILAQTRAFICK